MCKRLGAGNIVYGDYINVMSAHSGAEHVAADPSKTIYSYFDCHPDPSDSRKALVRLSIIALKEATNRN